MRKTSLLIASLAFAISAGCTTEKPGYTLTGTIDQSDGTIYLQSFRNKMFFIIDSAEIVDGKFQFSGKLEREDLFGLTTDREQNFYPWFIFLENSAIEVSIESSDARSAKITGSRSHDLYESYLANRRNFNIDSFIEAHPASVVPAYILYRDFSTRLDADELQKNVNRFDPSLNDLAYIHELEEVIAIKQRVNVGNPAVDFTGTTPDGSTINLSDYKGQYVLLQFWASWCGPCRRANPGYVALYNTYKEKGFDILSVSLDSKKESWVNAIESDQLHWSHVSDLKFWDSEPAGIYGIRHIPSNVLIDPAGIIVAKNLNGEALQNKLKELL